MGIFSVVLIELLPPRAAEYTEYQYPFPEDELQSYASMYEVLLVF